MKRDGNKTLLALRAQGYAERVAKEQEEAYFTTDAEILVEEAFIAGVKSGYEDMTDMFEWLNPAEELPHSDEEVLCMIHRPFQTYAVMRWLNDQWWQPLPPQPNVSLGGWIAAEKEPFAWRPIHEMEK